MAFGPAPLLQQGKECYQLLLFPPLSRLKELIKSSFEALKSTRWVITATYHLGIFKLKGCKSMNTEEIGLDLAGSML